MKRSIRLVLILVTALSVSILAESATTITQARLSSESSGKPMLLEFVREDCEYCELAKRDAASDGRFKEALKDVVHLPVNVLDLDGYELAKQYRVGKTYPVFILTNSEGDVINRWIGYIGVDQFVTKLERVLSDLTTVKERRQRFNAAASAGDAQFLARYHSETKEYLEAINYYRHAATLSNIVGGFSYQIFENSVEACWRDMLPFDKVLPTADEVVNSGDRRNISKMARVLVRLAIRKDVTDKIAKYILKGLEVTRDSRVKKLRESHELLRADSALYVARDQSGAVNLRKRSMATGWENDPAKFFAFSKWCLERKVNLAEAETLVRNAVSRASEGKLRANVHATLAQILDARDKRGEALEQMELAIEQDPSNEHYLELLEEIRDNSTRH